MLYCHHTFSVQSLCWLLPHQLALVV
uniref:Uncharacterized protein n=1 Tax=Anguilla anguilla TaxID=7936 RepID=A0A0E9QNI0_ANGAN